MICIPDLRVRDFIALLIVGLGIVVIRIGDLVGVFVVTGGVVARIRRGGHLRGRGVVVGGGILPTLLRRRRHVTPFFENSFFKLKTILNFV